MTQDTITSFVTYYVRDLAERTRKEESGTKYGFDWIVYNLGIALGWKPLRLPWLRSGADDISKTKTEPEFGVDLSFFKDNGESLVIFVLKDEVLSYKSWQSESFESDIRRAAAVNLNNPGFDKVTRVEVILAYNKDEHQDGVTSFENTAAALGTRVGDNASLEFSRWNLTEITERVLIHLLTPSLLPQSFFGQFSYLCSQFGDFVHGSDEWTNQLVPNWRNFLDKLVNSGDVRMLRLIPVTLVVLRAHGRETGGSTGWLDLAEWAMLAAWEWSRVDGKPKRLKIVEQMWQELYVKDLEHFYSVNTAHAWVEHGIQAGTSMTVLDAVADSYVAYWHMARLGLLVWNLEDSPGSSDPAILDSSQKKVSLVVDTLELLVSRNPAALRPVLDIQHIELFLLWRALWTAKRGSNIEDLLEALCDRLFIRRLGDGLQFVSGSNSWEIAFERVERSVVSEFGASSSNLLLMLMEFCCSLPAKKRDPLLKRYYLRTVQGLDDGGNSVSSLKPSVLLSWGAPDDWDIRILKEPVLDGSVIVEDFEIDLSQTDLGLSQQLAEYAVAGRVNFPLKVHANIPLHVYVLACLKHQSPIPPELWRSLLLTMPPASAAL